MAIKDTFSNLFRRGKGETETGGRTWPVSKTPVEDKKTGKFSSIFSRSRREAAPVDLGSRELGEYEKEQHEISQKLERAKQSRSGIARIFRHPFRFIFEKPLHILILTIPIALIVFVFGTAFAIRDYGMSVLFTSTLVDDIVILSILIVIVPLAILDFREA